MDASATAMAALAGLEPERFGKDVVARMTRCELSVIPVKNETAQARTHVTQRLISLPNFWSNVFTESLKRPEVRSESEVLARGFGVLLARD